jgi:hypothetical protein
MLIPEWTKMLVATKNTLRITIVMIVVYSYVCFFNEWNWYILYILNIVEKSN